MEDKKYLLVETDSKTKNNFKAYCARKNMSLKQGVNSLMKKAVKSKSK